MKTTLVTGWSGGPVAGVELVFAALERAAGIFYIILKD